MSLVSPPSTFTLPVSNTIQFQSVTFNVVANTAMCQPGSGCSNPYQLEQLAVSGCSPSYTVSVDMLNPAHPYVYSQGGSSCSAPPTDVFGGITAVPSGVKAPTYLWVPNDNSTLSSGLPVGLQRYVGEQDFVLVVADVSSTIGCTACSYTSNAIPYAWGQDYPQPITVSQTTNGNLVNFLVPRGQFLNSVLGQAVLNGKPLPTPAGSTASTAVDQITGQNLAWLACYWQGHAVAPSGYKFPDGSTSSGPSPSLCGNYQGNFQDPWAAGTDPGTLYSVTTVADTGGCGASPANCAAGGVPSNPTLETSCTGCAAPAVQAVVTLNLTSNSDLNDLLAGLLDNNTVGANGELGVNGSFEAVTYQLPSLGLSSTVMGALANAITESDGLNGTPVSEAVPPPPPPPQTGAGEASLGQDS